MFEQNLIFEINVFNVAISYSISKSQLGAN